MGILNLGLEVRWPTPAMGVKFANPPLELGLKIISWPSPSCINDKIYLLQYTRVSQYYENSKYISNLFFVMPYTYILDDSIKSPTLILTADHSTLLFLPGFFTKQRTSFFFCGWTSIWSQAYICMTLPLLTTHFSWPLPLLSLKKLWPSLCFHPRSPLLNFLSQVIFVFLLFWGMVMYANDIETNGKQKLPEIKN